MGLDLELDLLIDLDLQKLGGEVPGLMGCLGTRLTYVYCSNYLFDQQKPTEKFPIELLDVDKIKFRH